MINVFQPSVGAEELDRVRRVFESNWLGKGKLTEMFEQEFAQYQGAEPALFRSTTCCTEGLFQSMSLFGIGIGDEVVLPSISFVGAANAIVSCGAKPVFCDVDQRTLNATAETIRPVLTNRTKAVLLLHYGGVPCEMDPILELAQESSIYVIEDSACSVSSQYRGTACGCLGDFGVWSFDAMKILVTGDGAMVYCREEDAAARLQESLYLGLTTRSGLESKVDSKWWEIEVSCCGRRAVMNDVTAAIGLEQLKKLPSFIEKRRKIHETYDNRLGSLSWLRVPPSIPDHMQSSYYFYWIQTAPEVRDQLAVNLREHGIYTTFRYYPLHWVPYYASGETRLPGAEAAASQTLCIPQHQMLSDNDIGVVVDCILEFGKQL